MGLPALQQFASLTSAVEARSKEAVRAGEVISLALGGIVRHVNEALLSQDNLRSILAEGRSILDRTTPEDFSKLPIPEMAALRSLFRRFARVISRPMLERPTGWSLVKLAEKLEDADFPRLADRRLCLRQAHKLRDSAQLCERQRLRLHAQVVDMVKCLDEIAQGSGDTAAHEQAYMAELITATRDRHPVINAYLAR